MAVFNFKKKINKNIKILTILTILIILFLTISIIGIYYLRNRSRNINIFDLDDTIIYYINLDRSVKRKNNVEKMLKNNDLIGNRISGVDGKKINIDDEKYKKYFKKSKVAYNNYKEDYDSDKVNIGHFGCFLSHMKTYETFLKTNYKYAIIFEDDMEIHDFKHKLNKNIKNIPKDWDIILMQYNILEDQGNNSKFELNNNILKINGNFTGTAGYIINRNSAKILLKELEDHSWYIDYKIGDLSKDNKLEIYGIYPPFVCQPAEGGINIPSLNLKLENKCDTSMGSVTWGLGDGNE